MKKKIFLLIFSLLCTVILNAAILNVPADYATIQAGINAANTHDTVLVDTGTYLENINYNGKNITVASLFLTTQDTSYILQTVIDGDSLDSVVKFMSGEDSTAVLCGFTLTNGCEYSGGGIFCISSSPCMYNMKIIENNAAYGGGGRFVFSNPSIKNVMVAGNEATTYGGGFYFSFSTPILEKVNIINNNAEGGGGMYCYESSPIMNHILIADNYASLYGAGFLCYYCCSPIILNVTITNNQGYGYGAGIYTGNHSYPSFINCIISDNIGNYGIYNNPYHPGNPIITYSDIWNNQGGNFYNCSPGIGCLEADPLFVNPISGDYHLSWAHYPIPDATMSPCIDTGDPSSPPDPDGTITDMGAYYFNQNVSIDDSEDISDWTIGNFPNPIKNSTIILYSLKKNSHVMISIYNIKGQLVSTIIDKQMMAGEYTIQHQMSNLSAGIYFIKLDVNGKRKEVIKMVKIK